MNVSRSTAGDLVPTSEIIQWPLAHAAVQKLDLMTMDEKLAYLGLERRQTTRHTYVYVNIYGVLHAISKGNRNEKPVMEYKSYGYVSETGPLL